jgi:menaquinone-dependent protoporphyrinogen oxidase
MSATGPIPSGPRVLVVVASKYGGTRGIAEVLTAALPATDAAREAGLTAVLYDAAHAPAPGRADAVLVGSAVYAGRWREEARDYVTAHAAQLRTRPVWLFSSGPIGYPPYPPEEPHDVHPLRELVGARGHRVFAGRLDAELLSVGERAMVTAMRAPLGDFRDMDAVRAWATELAGELCTRSAPTT